MQAVLYNPPSLKSNNDNARKSAQRGDNNMDAVGVFCPSLYFTHNKYFHKISASNPCFEMSRWPKLSRLPMLPAFQLINLGHFVINSRGR